MYRYASTTRSGGGFSEETIEAVWRKATPVSGYPAFRTDCCGQLIQRDAYGDTSSPYGWEIDHVKPVSAGGTDDLYNLQPLHWENNRHKADNWPEWSCKLPA